MKTENVEEAKTGIEEKLKQMDNTNAGNIEEKWDNLKNCLQDIQENVVGMTVVGKPQKKRTWGGKALFHCRMFVF